MSSRGLNGTGRRYRGEGHFLLGLAGLVLADGLVIVGAVDAQKALKGLLKPVQRVEPENT